MWADRVSHAFQVVHAASLLRGTSIVTDETHGVVQSASMDGCLAASIPDEAENAKDCDDACATQEKAYVWTAGEKQKCRCVDSRCSLERNASVPSKGIGWRGIARLRHSAIEDDDGDVCEVVMPLWKVASKLLAPEKDSAVPSCKTLRWWARPSCTNQYGIPCTVTAKFNSGKVLRYEKIFKNANHAVVCNLEHMKGLETSFNILGSESELPFSHAEPSARLENATHFTIVREPMGRFVSAYSEVEHRIHEGKQNSKGYYDVPWWRRCNTHEPFRREPMGSVSRARSFLLNLFAGRLDRWMAYAHLFLQAPTLRHSGAVVVGTLENFEDSWEVVRRLAGQPNKTEPDPDWSTRDCGQHEKTDQNSNSTSREAMSSLMSSDRNVALALSCGYLLPDYVCLASEYERPSTDEECVEAGFASSAEAWAEVMAGVRAAFCPEGVHIK